MLAALPTESLTSTPGISEIAAALRTVDADALVYLLPRRLLIVNADATVTARPTSTMYGLDPGTPAGTDEVRDFAMSPPDAPDRLLAAADHAWDALIEPLLGALPAGPAPHRVVLVPGGELGAVPWHAARRGDRLALDDFAFSYAASARQLCAAAQRPRAATGVILLADPSGTLTWAGPEVEAVRRESYPQAIRLGPLPGASGPGTPDEVMDALAGGSAVLHLACHARAEPEPQRSWLRLTGPLEVSRILAAPHIGSGGLVVLSACATDLTIAAHDEAVTLATAFLAAGAVSVVGSRWPVDDRATAALMADFHRWRTTGGLNDRDALRAAQRTAAAEGAPLRVWAAFTHHGA